uniref:Uncharacterized protein n=1 Tax=Zea mays TaxID=4577 RepID=C4IZM6_MAIZE|nr:unknown [Zea mays]
MIHSSPTWRQFTSPTASAATILSLSWTDRGSSLRSFIPNKTVRKNQEISNCLLMTELQLLRGCLFRIIICPDYIINLFLNEVLICSK